jgi:hypothetical protein
MAKKINSAAISAFLKQVDHHQIYKLHMAQARDTKKQFINDPEMLTKIDAIIEKIQKTYAEACKEKEAT